MSLRKFLNYDHKFSVGMFLSKLIPALVDIRTALDSGEEGYANVVSQILATLLGPLMQDPVYKVTSVCRN